MTESNCSGRLARFGLFEADLRTGELRRRGQRVRLQDQPFRVLAALLEQAGEMLTRERIREKLWPGRVFVDFDHGLNAAVAKLRRVLGDFATSPRYVETVSRRGYRFIAPVEWLDRPTGASVASVPAGIPRVTCEGRTVPLHDGDNVIGRDSDCEVCVDSSTVSRHHAHITVDGAGVTFEDLGSKNGSYVGGNKVTGVVLLADGDEIQAGSVTFIFRAASPSERTRTHRRS